MSNVTLRKIKRIISIVMSVIMILQLGSGLCIQNVYAANSEGLTITDNSLLINGVNYTEGMEVNAGSSFALSIDWTIANSAAIGEEIRIDLPSCLKFSEEISGDQQHNGVVVGKYKVVGNQLVITLTNELESNTAGRNSIEGKLSDSYIPTEDKKNVTLQIYDKSYTLTVVKTDSTHALNVQKTYQGAYDSDKGLLYQIRVSSTGKNSNVSIKDVLDSTKMTINGDVTVKSSLNGDISGTLSKSDNGFVYNLPGDYVMQNGEYITLEYYAKYKDGVLDSGNTNTKNTVTASSTESTSVSTDCWYSFSKTWITKNATLSSDGKSVSWKIRVNEGNPMSLNGAVLSDYLPGTGEFEFTSDIVIKNISTNSVAKTISMSDAKAGNGFSYTFGADDKSVYEITYTTSVDKTKSPNYSKVTDFNSSDNVAKLNIDGKEKTSAAHVTFKGIEGIFTKEYTSFKIVDDKGVIHWKSSVTVPDPSITTLDKLRITDSVDSIEWANVNHYLDTDSLVVKIDGTVVDPSKYNLVKNDKYGFVVDFGETFKNAGKGSIITLEYDTSFNLPNTTREMSNSSTLFIADVAVDTSSAKYRYTPVVMKDYVEIVNGEKGNKKFKWRIHINFNSDSITDGIVYVKEQLPENHEIIADSIRVENNQYYDGRDLDEKKKGVTLVGVTDGVATIKIDGSQVSKDGNGKAYLYVETQFADVMKFLTSSAKAYENKVVVQNSNNEDIGGAKVFSPTVTPDTSELLYKDFKYDQYTAPYVYYYVNVNPNGISILGENKDNLKLTLTDELGKALVYVPNTLKIFKDAARSVELPTSEYSVKYDSAANVITIYIPDKTPCYLEYKAMITLKQGEQFSSDKDSDKYGGNKISLTGTSFDKVSSEKVLTGSVFSSAGVIVTEVGSVGLYKYSKDNYDIAVPNAEYTATIKYCVKDGNIVPATSEILAGRNIPKYNPGKIYKTDSDGTIIFDNIYYDYLYEIKEVNAPSEYLINDTKVYFYIAGEEAAVADYANSPVVKAAGIDAVEMISGQYINVYDELKPEELKKIAIDKKIEGTTSSLAGAALNLIDGDGAVVAEWTSSGSPRQFQIDDGKTTGISEYLLKTGVTYTLREVSAPRGYSLSSDVKFSVDASGNITVISDGSEGGKDGATVTTDGEIQVLSMFDEREIFITKLGDDGKEALAGATFTISDGTANISFTTSSSEKNHMIPVVSSTTNAGSNKLAVGVEYTLKETSAPEGYYAAKPIQFKVNSEGKVELVGTNDNAKIADGNLGIEVIDNAKITLKIVKKDLSATPLAGAEFVIKNSQGKYVKQLGSDISYVDNEGEATTFTSQADGTVSVAGLTLGSYVIVEKTAPSGYNIVSTETPVVITKDNIGINKTFTKEITNIKAQIRLGNLEVTKVEDGSGVPLSGVEFTLVNDPSDNGTESFIATATTDAYGKATFVNVPFGKYILKETKSKYGYSNSPTSFTYNGYELNGTSNGGSDTGFSLSDGKCNVVINAASTGTTNTDIGTAKVTVGDTKLKGKLIVTKKDKADSSVLSGATFELSGNGITTTTATTDAYGNAVFDNLPYGTYTLKEIEAPKYYRIDNKNAVTVTIDSSTLGGGEVKREFSDTKLVMYIQKKADDSEALLSGAQLQIIRQSDSSVVKTFTSSNSAQEISLSELLGVADSGAFILRETSAPTGYAIASDIEFTVSYNQTEGTYSVTSATGEVTVNNACFYLTMRDEHVGNITITKRDAAIVDGVNKALAGAEFKLYKVNSDNSRTAINDLTPVKGYWVSGNQYKTDDDGVLSFEGLKYGTYALIEVVTPTGYFVTSTENIIVLKTGDAVKDIYNTKKGQAMGNVMLTKVDREDDTIKLDGASFDLYQVDDNGDKTWITAGATGTKDAEGSYVKGVLLIENIPYGKYQLIEKENPKNYKLDTNCVVSGFNAAANCAVTEDGDGKLVISFEINKDSVTSTAQFPVALENGVNTGGLISFTLTNDAKKRDFFVKKVTEDNVTPIKGVTFGLFENMSIATAKYTATSDANGIAKFSDVKYGEYYLKEISTPDNYIKTFNSVKVFIDDTTETGSYSYKTAETAMLINNTQRKIVISKKELNGSSELPGAKLKITSKDSSGYSKVWTSGSGAFTNGIELKLAADATEAINSSGNYIYPGEFILEETSAPTGYAIQNKIEFKVSATGEITVNAGSGEYGLSLDKTILTMYDEPVGRLIVTKVDALNNSLKLAGAQFKLFKKADIADDIKKAEEIPAGKTPVATITTGADGGAIFDKLPYGDYVLFETKLPSGRIATTERFDITLNAANVNATHDYELTVANMIEVKTASIKITKLCKEETDAGVNSENPLSGVVFALTTTGGVEIARATTNADGKITFANVPYGTYYLEEITAPDGYAKKITIKSSTNDCVTAITGTSDKVTIDLLESKCATSGTDKYVDVTFTNELKRGALKVIKIDSKTEEFLEGAEFKVYLLDKNNPTNMSLAKQIGTTTYRTDEKGEFTIDNLLFGTYKIIETKEPDNYKEVSSLTEDEKTTIVEVNKEGTADSAFVKVIIKNKVLLADFSIRKTDKADNDIYLKGATYELYSSKKSGTNDVIDKLIATGITDESGVYKFKELAYGVYFVKEKTAPANYEVDDNAYKVIVPVEKDNLAENAGKIVETSPTNPTKVYTVSDVKSLGEIVITKVDGSDNSIVLKGAEFELYNSAGKKVKSGTTDSNGKLTFKDLEYGTYSLKEVKAPKYYNIEKSSFSVNVDRKVVEVTVKNYTNSITISKRATEKGQELIDTAELAGASLQILDSSDNVVVSWTTASSPKEIGIGDKTGYILPDTVYTLRETKAPLGYLVAKDIKFKTDVDGNITIVGTEGKVEDGRLVMVDMLDEAYTMKKIYVSKRNVVTQNDPLDVAVSGAQLAVKDENGNVIKSFVSGEAATEITVGGVYGLLKYDTKYILTEVLAPNGYELAKDIVFTVSKDGVVSIVGDNGSVDTKTTLVMRDAKKDATPTPKPDPTQPEPTPEPDPTQPDDTPSDPTPTPDGSIATGDKAPIAVLIVLIVGTVLCMGYFLITGKKKDDDDDDDGNDGNDDSSDKSESSDQSEK